MDIWEHVTRKERVDAVILWHNMQEIYQSYDKYTDVYQSDDEYDNEE